MRAEGAMGPDESRLAGADTQLRTGVWLNFPKGYVRLPVSAILQADMQPGSRIR